jgi:zinc transporter ZupT
MAKCHPMLELFAQAVAQQQPQAGFQSLIPGLLSALTAAIGGVTAYMIAKLSSKADVMVKPRS